MNNARTPDPVGDGAVPVGALPGARSALVLLLLINLFNYIDRYVLAAVVPDIRRAFFSSTSGPPSALDSFLGWFQHAFGFKPENALLGILSTAFMLTFMVAAPIFGRLAESRSRWSLIGVGVILWSLASGATGLAGTFLILLLTRCFVGIGEAAYGPVAPTVISDFYPIAIRGQVLARFYMAIPVGSALGYVLGEQVANHLGWRWAFYLVVIPGIALGCWALRKKEPPRGRADLTGEIAPVRVKWKDYLILARTPSYVLNTLGMCAMTFAIGGIGFWMPDYVKEYRGVAGPSVTIFGAVLTLAGVTGTLLGGMAGDGLRKRFPGSYFLVSAAAMFAGFPLFLAVLYVGFPLAWVFIFLACFCLFFNTGPTNTILANVVHPSIRATAFAVNIFFIHALGDVLSPVLIGIIADKSNMNVAFLVVGVMFLVSGVFWAIGARYLARDVALAPTRLSPNSSGLSAA
ncbi:MAG TPA: MFS transporter [Verrucomicrobiae bacterium]|nr:MFS transporter [Verrucomicrobiae bacterium]